MKKSLGRITNDFCPQTLFLYGTYKDDGSPNFALFCWFSYCHNDDLSVMACIGEKKLTKDLITKNGVFSANLVSEELLPLADYFGTKSGYDADKMKVPFEVTKGEVLDVPVLERSPLSYELEVKNVIDLGGDSDLYICGIRNILVNEELLTSSQHPLSLDKAKPVVTTGATYFSVGEVLGQWGDWHK